MHIYIYIYRCINIYAYIKYMSLVLPQVAYSMHSMHCMCMHSMYCTVLHSTAQYVQFYAICTPELYSTVQHAQYVQYVLST